MFIAILQISITFHIMNFKFVVNWGTFLFSTKTSIFILRDSTKTNDKVSYFPLIKLYFIIKSKHKLLLKPLFHN